MMKKEKLILNYSPDKKIKVLIVDDSQLVQRLIAGICEESKELEVVGIASDPYEARELIKKHHPDVLTLDIEMPKMNGYQFLQNLMRLKPMPVVMISSLTQKGADITMKCLEAGAVDFIAKDNTYGKGLVQLKDRLVRVIKHAAQVDINRLIARQQSFELKNRKLSQEIPNARHWLIAIGSSTGGIMAIETLLDGFTKKMPGIVIVQHIPKGFCDSLVARLDRKYDFSIKKAQNDQVIEPGCVYIAPGDQHLRVIRKGSVRINQVFDGEPVNNHKPSVEVMFDSLKSAQPENVIAVMLTGMGDDGAKAMAALHDLHTKTIVQDQSTSVVWGMPGAVVKLGVADEILPLDKIAPYIENHLLHMSKKH